MIFDAEMFARPVDHLRQRGDEAELVGAVGDHKEVGLREDERRLRRGLLAGSDVLVHRRQVDAVGEGRNAHRDRRAHAEEDGHRRRDRRIGRERRVEGRARERGRRVEGTELALARVEDALVLARAEDVTDQPAASRGEHSAQRRDCDPRPDREGRLRADDGKGAEAERVANEEGVAAQEASRLEGFGGEEGDQSRRY